MNVTKYPQRNIIYKDICYELTSYGCVEATTIGKWCGSYFNMDNIEE